MILTKAQRTALKRVYDRIPIFEYIDHQTHNIISSGAANDNPISYRQFRRMAVKSAYDDCVMIPWCNMWLGIETNGCTHS
ncbi:MAG: hypothetical protein GY820_21115 [Gammaproteobacteria bacterium]|nr:hypothetical protein [Gammaproteobacteria bacterium]